jgi:hypothetical protein
MCFENGSNIEFSRSETVLPKYITFVSIVNEAGHPRGMAEMTNVLALGAHILP